ncbi:hypothetical protein AX16_002375 [Volvariella volvacea WC 439]|nr:hypothetical protein AX16_002375 [Volvariella volvacea WC 439]
MPAVTSLHQLPTFVSPAQYDAIVATTPTSFHDIPAVCRHREERVQISFDPPIPDLSQDDSQGTLLVLTSKLVFMANTGRGFEIPYPAITLHAISRAGAGPSIYCQLDECYDEHTGTDPDGVDIEDMRELSIRPDSSDSLEAIFEALSQCAALHPDPADLEDEDGDAFVDPDSMLETFTGTEEQELSEVGKAALTHLESIIHDPFHDPAVQNETEPSGGVDSK